MLRLGLLDFDTSHVVAFTQRLNHIDSPEEQWVEGARVVVGCPGTSAVMPERIPEFAKKVGEEYGVELVSRPEEMLGRIDGVLIESNDGRVHLERARPFLEAGIPCWIDKPLAWSTREAEAIFELAQRYRGAVFSASASRFSDEVLAVVGGREELGAPVAVQVWGPQVTKYKDLIPGWFFYGIHAVEMLFELAGSGHQGLRYTRTPCAELAVASLAQGAVLGSATLYDVGAWQDGFTYLGRKKRLATIVKSGPAYRNLLREIVKFMQTGKAPVAPDSTLDVIRFIEAVNASGASGAAAV